MADHRRLRRNTARIIAPLALIACGVALAMVVSSFNEERKKGDEPEARGTTQAGERTNAQQNGQRRPRRRIYRVKLNDTLALISEKTGVPAERLQELNPELVPYNLSIGQRVKLRE